jgi:hypothetical protein
MELRCRLGTPRSPGLLRAVGLCNAIAILVLGGGVGLTTNPSYAKMAETEPEAAEPAAARAREAAKRPNRLRPLERRQLRLQKKKDWWAHARTVLFTDIELNEEQIRDVDAIVEEQLLARADFLAGDAKLKTVRRRGKRADVEAIRADLREVKARLRERHELFEDFRALLREEQHPRFDMNRAHLVAEDQNPPEDTAPSEPEGIPVSSRRSPSS